MRTQAGFGMTVEHDLGRADEADLIAVPARAEGQPVPDCVLDTLRAGSRTRRPDPVPVHRRVRAR